MEIEHCDYFTGASDELKKRQVEWQQKARAAGGETVKKTICSICNPVSHCGVDAHVRDGVVIKIEGTRENPHNAGTLCAKGAAGRQYVYHKDRIRTPLVRLGSGKTRGAGRFQPIGWDEALDMLADRLHRIKSATPVTSVRGSTNRRRISTETASSTPAIVRRSIRRRDGPKRSAPSSSVQHSLAKRR